MEKRNNPTYILSSLKARLNLVAVALVAVVVAAAMIPLSAHAQTVTANAPAQVAVNEQFRLTYKVSTDNVEAFNIGKLPEGIERLAGPKTSTYNSIQINNNKMQHESSVTFTYILVANKAGTFTMPAAQVGINGKTVVSNTVKVSATTQKSSQHAQQPQAARPSAKSGAISGQDLFIRVSANKKKVVEQEPVMLTYKLYTQVELREMDGKMPDLKSFYVQEYQPQAQPSFKQEVINGRIYHTATWQQYVMFPQTTGKLKVPSITYKGKVVQRLPDVDIFEAMLNGGSNYREVQANITAPEMEIQVDHLPVKPDGFSGGVGKFAIKASVDKQELKSDDPITLRVEVSGLGNMKLLKQPLVDFPKDFDTYDPKQSEKTHLTPSGIEGTVTYEFLAVPRHQGKYTIPPVKFVYYDLAKHDYVTLSTESFSINVLKGDGSQQAVTASANKEDLKLLAKDILHIDTDNASMHKRGQRFYGSMAYILINILLIIAFAAIVIAGNKRISQQADVVRQKGKKANKVAVKRLKKAASMMQKGQNDIFFDEVLRALWGYVGDRLNMPVEQLSAENIASKLQSRDIDQDTIQQFIDALDECQYQRYAPGDSAGNMEKVYNKALSAIEEIEQLIKKSKK